MLEINGKEFSDAQVVAEYKKRKSEYLQWRRQKAAEFLKNKKRSKCYHCVISDDGHEEDYFFALPDDIVARVRNLKERIKNDSSLKSDVDRADEYHDCIDEIGQDVEIHIPMPEDYIFTDIDIDDYIYLYRFDLHFFNWKGDKNGKRIPSSTVLTDEEYIELLTLLLDDPDCSFNHLVYLSPKLRAIHKKVGDDLHHTDFGVGDFLCEKHDYAVLMTEVREDANKLIKQLEKKGEQYPYRSFLKDPVVSIIVATEQHKTKNNH